VHGIRDPPSVVDLFLGGLLDPTLQLRKLAQDGVQGGEVRHGIPAFLDAGAGPDSNLLDDKLSQKRAGRNGGMFW